MLKIQIFVFYFKMGIEQIWVKVNEFVDLICVLGGFDVGRLGYRL